MGAAWAPIGKIVKRGRRSSKTVVSAKDKRGTKSVRAGTEQKICSQPEFGGGEFHFANPAFDCHQQVANEALDQIPSDPASAREAGRMPNPLPKL